jgi:hypothetical protein
MSKTNAANPQAHPVASPAQAPADASGELLLIQRMSVRYDGLEDRIALDVASEQGRVARLWLTRHGTDTMVRTTAAQVESYATAQLAKARVAPSDADQIRQSALAAQQLTARLTQRNATAVELTPGSTEHLVTGFAMPAHKHGIQLDFRCRPEVNARVVLQSAELFQWLGALQRQYQRAGWALDVWPAWLSQRSMQ